MNDATVQSLQQTEAAKQTVLVLPFAQQAMLKLQTCLPAGVVREKRNKKNQKHRNKTNAYLTTQIRETQGKGPLNTI